MGVETHGHGAAPEPQDVAPTVTVIDTATIFRSGLIYLFNKAGYLCTARTTKFQNWAADAPPTLFVILVRSSSQLTITEQIHRSHPAVPILALASQEDVRLYARIIRSGASAVLPSEVSEERLITTTKATINGDSTLPLEVAVALSAGNAARHDIDDDDIRIIRELAQGRTISSTARRLGFAERSLHRHLAKIYQKLGAKNRSEAIAEVARMGWLEPDS